MRILFLCQLVPYPPDSGPKVRAYYNIRYLSKHHEITLLAFSRLDDSQEALDHLKSLCEEVYTVPLVRSRWRDIRSLIKSIFKRKPFVIERDTLPEMTVKVHSLLQDKEFDAIHSDQLWMAQYNPLDYYEDILKVLDEHNACFQVFQRLAMHEKNILKRLVLEREWRSLEIFEAQMIPLFNNVVTVTPQDKTILEQLTKPPKNHQISPPFTVIPICVDAANEPPIELVESTLNILHLGTMFWLPNVEGVLWFARQVFPLIKDKIPQASFTIVGKNPPSEIRALEKGTPQAGARGLKAKRTDRANVNKGPSGSFSSNTNIFVTGYAADPSLYLKNAAVFIIPLLSGSGMRVKILDAWRWGIPVVSTSVGAEGIEYLDGENILIADKPTDFADAVGLILQDVNMARFLRENGRKWVEEKYDWRRIYTAWDTIYPRDGDSPVQ